MTPNYVLPTWLKIFIGVAFLVGGALWVNQLVTLPKATHVRSEANVDNVRKNFSDEAIQKASVSVFKGVTTNRIELGQQTYKELASRVTNLRLPTLLGWRGPWQYYSELKIEGNRGSRLRIVFMTRPSLDGKAIAYVEVPGDPAYFADYDGNELWTWIKNLSDVSKEQPPGQR